MKIMRCQLAAVLVLILAVPVLAADDHRLVEAAKKAYEAKAAAYESGLTNDVEVVPSLDGGGTAQCGEGGWQDCGVHSASRSDETSRGENRCANASRRARRHPR